MTSNGEQDKDSLCVEFHTHAICCTCSFQSAYSLSLNWRRHSPKNDQKLSIVLLPVGQYPPVDVFM